MDGSMFRESFALIWGFIIFLIVLLPLGLWKAIEIIIWLCHHIHFSFS